MGAGSGVGWGQGAAAWHGHAHALVNGGGPSEQEVGLSQRECLPFCRILIFYTPTSYLPLTAILSALSVCAPLSGRVGCAELQECKTLLLQTIMCLLQTSPAANQPFPPLHIDPPSYTVQRGRRRWAAGRERPHRPCGAGGTVAAEPRRGMRRYIQDTGHGERGGEGRGSEGGTELCRGKRRYVQDTGNAECGVEGEDGVHAAPYPAPRSFLSHSLDLLPSLTHPLLLTLPLVPAQLPLPLPPSPPPPSGEHRCRRRVLQAGRDPHRVGAVVPHFRHTLGLGVAGRKPGGGTAEQPL